MTQKAAKRLIDVAEIRRSLNVLVAPDQVTELRILNATTQSSPRYPYTASGYFSNTESLLKELSTLRTAQGVYITLQPCKRDLLARAKNRLRSADEMKSAAATADNHIDRYRWLLIDCDPERPAGISSSDEEHEQALTRVQEIRRILKRMGWPEPIEADSSNGGHLVYRIDLLVTDSALIQRVLIGLAGMFDTDGLHIDTTVYNAARISKLYGTLACKGDDTDERPHRISRILSIPESIAIVPRELLVAMAAPEQPKATNTSYRGGGQGQEFDIESFIRKHNLDVTGPKSWNGGDKWVFSVCPWNRDHTDRSAYILRFANGAIAAGCQHNGCNGLKWQDLRTLYEPDAYTRKEPYTEYRAEKPAPANGNGNSTHPKSETEESPKTESQDTSDAGKKAKEESQALQLVKMVTEEEHAELFSTSKGEFYARIKVSEHVHTLNIGERGGAFKRWLINLYLERTGNIPNATALSSAIDVLEAKAQWGKARQREVYVRLAHHDGKVYLDLANDACEVIEVDAHGWGKAKDPPVCFRRPDGMLPLPFPVRGGSLDDLKPFINVTVKDKDGNDKKDHWSLIKAWELGCFHPTGPYPILDLSGERGSAKTSSARYLRMVLDPHQALLRKEPKDDQTFAIMAHNNYIVGMDNLSHISSRLSDLMCTLSTGAGDAYRRHYSNDEEVIFSTRRPQLFTGIEELATRGDLIDRCIIISLPQMDEDKRRDERTLDKEFEEAHPRILGALLDAVSLALRNLPKTHIDKLPRMADFALWVVAAEEKITGQPGAFLEAYRRNREEGISTEIEASPVGNAILKFMEDTESWDSTATDLLTKLKALVDEDVTHQHSWPKNARALSGAIRRLAPSLRAKGLFLRPYRAGDGGHIEITRIPTSYANLSENDANLSKSDANSEPITQKNSSLRHNQTVDSGDLNPSMTQSDANIPTYPYSDGKEKREEEESKGIDRNNPESLRHFASPLNTDEEEEVIL